MTEPKSTPRAGCRRVFLGWSGPFLSRVVDYLAGQGVRGRAWDLSDLMLVLPTSWASVRLSELLLRRAVKDDLQYRRPIVITAGELPERLFESEVPPAIEFEQTLAWARVLKRQTAERLQPLVPTMPDSAGLSMWLELAGTLRRLSTDLASHRVPFADVLAVAETESERRRWALLADLHDQYLKELANARRGDPYQQRQWAIDGGRVRTDKHILLAGTSDLNESILAVLDAVSSETTALIAAPDQKSALFDRWGRIVPEAFADHRLPLQDDQLIPAADIGDQVTAAAEAVERFAASHRSDQIVVGVTDPSQIAPLEIELESAGRSPYRYSGRPVQATAVGRLIDRTATLLTVPTWRSLAALVRHSDVHRLLTEKLESLSLRPANGDFLVDLDALLTNHLPVRLAEPLPEIASETYPLADRLATLVAEWLTPLTGQCGWRSDPNRSAETLPISQWCQRIADWLATLYGDASNEGADEDGKHDGHAHEDREHGGSGPFASAESTSATSNSVEPRDEGKRESAEESARWSVTSAAVAKVNEILRRFASLSGDLDEPVGVAVALEMIAGRLADLQVADRPGADQIPIRGWLDLAMDDAPAMVVLGLNHPFVPSAVTSDPFLPGSIRSQLRVGDNERRHARDLYAMHLMLSTREQVRFVVGKTAADGSPTPPSRLLAAATADDIARRIRGLLQRRRPEMSLDTIWQTAQATTELPIPTLDAAGSSSKPPVTRMSVTAFKSYLECPYRFYLRHVLKLKPVDDAARELAANQFGDLVHAAVETFGESDAKDETDEEKIFDALRDHLHDHASQHFGRAVEPAVTLQIQQAERRLAFVAAEQARRIAAGWRIHDTEAQVMIPDAIQVEGGTMALVGRLDRIDQHQSSGQWAILDYKTHGHKPEKKHLKKISGTDRYEWIDLQLPLYRLMIPALGIDAAAKEVQLGYFNVSDKADETKINIAEFSEPLMDQAQQLIEQCVRRILAGDFAPSSDRVQYDDYSMILQTDVASRMLASASLEDAEETQ